MGPDARQAPARAARADARRRARDRDRRRPAARRRGSLEDGPIGLAVFLASGKRRGRLGDLLGGTIVARPTPGLPRAGFSPLLIAVPAGLAAAAIAVVLGFSRARQRARTTCSAVDKTCARNAGRRCRDRPRAGSTRSSPARPPTTARSPRSRRPAARASCGRRSSPLDASRRPRGRTAAGRGGAADARPTSPPSAGAAAARGEALRASSACAPAPASDRAPRRGVTTPQVAGATASGPRRRRVTR